MNRRFLILSVSLATSCCAQILASQVIGNEQATTVAITPTITDANVPVASEKAGKQQAKTGVSKIVGVSITGPFYYAQYYAVIPLTADEKDKALIEAASDGDVESVEALLAGGAKVNVMYGQTNANDRIHREDTALLAAIGSFDFTKFENHTNFLLEHREDYANLYSRIVEKLINVGSDVNVKRADGTTPLILACRRGLVGAVKKILASAKINEQNEKGDSALHAAAKILSREYYPKSISESIHIEAVKEAVQELILAGADKTLRNKAGKTAYDVALEYDNLELAELLK